MLIVQCVYNSSILGVLYYGLSGVTLEQVYNKVDPKPKSCMKACTVDNVY